MDSSATAVIHPSILWGLLSLLGTGLISTLLYIWFTRKEKEDDKFLQLEAAITESNTELAKSISKVAVALEKLGDGFSSEIGALHARITKSDREFFLFRAEIVSKVSKVCATCTERGNTCPGRNPEFLKFMQEVVFDNHNHKGFQSKD